jgi:aspartyl-tRNA(Asn)/glutamyl-tRNA(Gln) amidotransferase subunit A
MDRRHGDWASQESLIRRAQGLEPLLHAYVAFAAPVETPRGFLSGLPYAAKDIFAAPDRRPCGGLSAPLPSMETNYADVLRQLDGAGAMRVGYTALTEIAYEPSGINPHGSPRNPWNPDFICGGSSSGSAVAVASRSVVSALGSDTGGSLRIPAQACGVAAWKPTWGTVSTRGAMPLAPTLDTIGFLMRHAVNVMKAATVLANPRDEMVTSAVVIRDALAAAHPSIAKACQDGIAAIAAEDVEIEQRDGLQVIEACDEPVFTIMQGEAARCHRALLDEDATGPTLRRRLAKGLDIDDATLGSAVAQRPALAAAFVDRVLQFAEIAILPVTPIRTPPVSECDPASATFRARTLYELSSFTRFVNMIGFPAVVIPVGFDDRGMPVALQMVGRPGSDLGLLQLAYHVQRHTQWLVVPDAVAAYQKAMP